MSSAVIVFGPMLLTFSVIGGVMAYLITLSEYRKHFLDAKAARKHALMTAVFAFLVLLGLALGALSVFMRLESGF